MSLTSQYLVTNEQNISAQNNKKNNQTHFGLAFAGRLVKVPSNEDEWLSIANEFENEWNFRNCVGAIDGKHIVTQAQLVAHAT